MKTILQVPDEVMITVNAVATLPLEEENTKTMSDIIRWGIIQNLLKVTKSIDSVNKIMDILIGNNQFVYDLLDSKTVHATFNIREIHNC